MRRHQPCAEWPNCQCPKCERHRRRLDRGWRQTPAGVQPSAGDTGESSLSRRGVLCTYCQEAVATTWDHTTPRSRGGRHKVPACYTCNKIKGDMAYEDWALVVRAGLLPLLRSHGKRALARIDFEELRRRFPQAEGKIN